MPPEDQPIGAFLRALRKQKGLTIRDVADRIGLSFSRLAEFERSIDSHSGRPTLPRYEVVRRLANVYGVAPDELLRRAGFTPGPELPDDEQRLLAAYRRLGEERRSLLLRTLESDAGWPGDA